MNESAAKRHEEAIRLLRSEPLLSESPEDFVEALAAACKIAGYAKGEKIVEKGAEHQACHFVMEGVVSLTLDLPNGRAMTVDRLRRGARFGEACFFEAAAANYGFAAETRVETLRLDRQAILETLARHPHEAERVDRIGRVRPVQRFLSRLPLFATLPARSVWEIAEKLERQTCAAGEAIIREGEEGDYLYIVERGSFRVCRESAGGGTVATLTSGDVAGEMALFEKAARSASVIAREESTVLRLRRDDFSALLEHDRSLRKSIRNLVESRHRSERQAGEAPLKEKRRGFAEPESVKLPPPAVKGPLKFGRARYPIVRQNADRESGAACLATLCAFYGAPIGLNHVLELLRGRRGKASMTGLVRVAGELGFETVSCRASFGLLRKGPLPAIVNLDGSHWAALFKAEKSAVVIGDPAQGVKELSREEFEKRWAGFAIFLSPTERFKRLKPAPKGFSRFLPHVLPYRRCLGEIALTSLAIKFFAVFLPLLNMHIIDNVLMKGDGRFFVPSIVAVAILTLFQFVATNLRQNIVMFVGRKATLSILSAFYRRLLDLPMGWYGSRSVGDITTRFEQNQTITEFMTNTGVETFLDFLTAILVSMIFFALSPLLMAITFGFIVFDVVQVYFVSPFLQRNFRNIYSALSEVQSHFIESLEGMKTIKTLGIGHQARWRMENLYTGYKNVQLKGEAISAGMKVGTGFVSSFCSAALLFVGAFLVFDGKMTIGALIAFLSLVNYVRNPLVNIVRTWDNFQETLNAIDRVNEIYDAPTEQTEEDREGLVDLPTLAGNIEFSDVCFRYDEDAAENILNNVTVSIPAGQKVAFVGRSGSGKSTFLNLLFGFYMPNSGRLLVDGFDIRDCWLPSLRGQIGAVLQKEFLFYGTIRENIARGKPSAGMDEIVEAARMAAAHDFIMNFSEGYETVLSGRGDNLSGGQRQRIALARAFLQDPQILILDEATSALDNESERFVMENIRRRYKHRTIIMIAHRLSTVRDCDRIFVMDKGRVIESGDYAKLMEQKGMFYLLNSKQGA